jgi:hypothetical protein
MGMRWLLSLVVVTAVSAVGVALAGGAGTPIAASMVLDTPDFAHGGVIVSEGAGLVPNFPHFPTLSSYVRSFRNVAVGNAELDTLSSNAAIAKSAADPARFMATLIAAVRSPSQRKIFVAVVEAGLSRTLKATSTTLIRGRVIHAGDSGVDLLFRAHLKAGTFDIGEVWVEVGPSLALLIYGSTGPPVTAGSAFQLARIAASHMSLALEPAPSSEVAPTISGMPQVGQPLTATPGTWKGTAPQFSYQWLRCNPTTSVCLAIPGAITATYAVTSADSGSTLVVSVTAITRAGSTDARSQPTQPAV